MIKNKKNTEGNLQLILNTSPIGMFILNEHLIVEKINNSALELFALSEEGLGQRLGNLIHCPGSSEDIRGCSFGRRCRSCELRSLVEAAHQTGSASAQLEFPQVLIQNGTERKYWLRTSITPLVMDGQHNLVVAMENISDSKLAEDSAKKYQVLLEKARDIILFMDLEGNILEFNQAAIQAYGYTKEELLTLKVFDLREQNDLTLKQMKQAEEQGILFETRHVRKDGSIFSVEISAYGTLIGDQRVLVSIIRDITERKKAESELIQTKENQRVLYERYRSLIMNMPDSFAYNRVIYDQAGTALDYEILEINEAYEKIFKVKRAEIIGTKYSELFSGEDLEIFKQKMAEYGEVASKGVEIVSPIYYSEWSKGWFSVKLYSPEPGFFVSLITDMTERIRVENELHLAKDTAEAANRAKSEFLANMSHEIRTPINGMVGMIDLTLLKEIGQEQRENLEIAKACADSLLKIINDILDFSKIEAGKLVIEKIGFNLRELLDSTIKAHLPVAMHKKLELSCNCSDSIQDVLQGDPNRLKQILNNLLNNALKFTEQGGVTLTVVPIALTDETIEIKFSVADTGIGISDQEQAKLFRTFSQVDGSITRKYGGTGLGLVISKQLVQMMGGMMTVESQKGRGSRFSFTLKFKLNGELCYPQQDNPQPVQTSRPLKILIVEDDKVNLMVLAIMLKEKGHFVESATNGSEALLMHAKSVYDVIFMDIQMPVMDGIEATTKIRAREGTSHHTPIIALTAYALVGDREKFLSYGLDEYIPKPIKMDELFRVLEEVVNRSTQEKERAVELGQEVVISEKGIILNIKPEGVSGGDKLTLLPEISEDIQELQLALTSKDLNLIEDIAHKIKSNCNLIEADELKTLAFKIELAARRENFEEAAKYSLLIKQEFEIYGCLEH